MSFHMEEFIDFLHILFGASLARLSSLSFLLIYLCFFCKLYWTHESYLHAKVD